MNYLGDFAAGSIIYVPFATYDKDDGSSVTLTGLAVTDIEIYKNGSTTQRASDSGFNLLDTDGIDFDGITGIHGFSIDTSDNTTAGFFAAGADYWVVVSSITVDGVVVNFIAAVFSIENRRVITAAAITDAVWLKDVTGHAAPTVGAYIMANYSNVDVVLNRIGAFVGTSTNTIHGWLRAIMRKDLTKPTDIGGTYAVATDSLEAVGDQIDRILGLMGKNSGVRNFTHSAAGDVLTFDICVYDTSGNAATNDGVTGLLYKYSVVNTYSAAATIAAGVTTQVT